MFDGEKVKFKPYNCLIGKLTNRHGFNGSIYGLDIHGIFIAKRSYPNILDTPCGTIIAHSGELFMVLDNSATFCKSTIDKNIKGVK